MVVEGERGPVLLHKVEVVYVGGYKTWQKDIFNFSNILLPDTLINKLSLSLSCSPVLLCLSTSLPSLLSRSCVCVHLTGDR